MRSSTVFCVVTSSAVVGSSAIKRSGSAASAIARAHRWHWPPESSQGYDRAARAGSGRPVRSSSDTARAAASLRGTPGGMASTIWRPMRITGFSAPDGFWNT